MRGLWLKLSVDYLDDPKIAAVGVEGEALFIRGLAWAKKAESSIIPFVMLTRLGTGITDPQSCAAALVAMNLWRKEADGWVIVAWDSWQTDPVRSAGGTLGNHRRWHAGKHVDGCEHCAAERATSAAPAPAPAPKKEPKKEPVEVQEQASVACQLLSTLMVSNGCREPLISPSWLRDMDAINRLDGHDWVTITKVIRWSQADPFWKSNILSPGKLRKQFDRLLIKARDTGAVEAPKKKEAWVADPACFYCGGEGWLSRESERGGMEYAPCHCRTKPDDEGDGWA